MQFWGPRNRLRYSDHLVIPLSQWSWGRVYWFHLVHLSIHPSVCLSASALYLQQYLSDRFHICTSYQATSEGVSYIRFISKLQNLKFWRILQIHNFDCLLLTLDPIWLNNMGNHEVAGVSSECRHSSCSSYSCGVPDGCVLPRFQTTWVIAILGNLRFVR